MTDKRDCWSLSLLISPYRSRQVSAERGSHRRRVASFLLALLRGFNDSFTGVRATATATVEIENHGNETVQVYQHRRGSWEHLGDIESSHVRTFEKAVVGARFCLTPGDSDDCSSKSQAQARLFVLSPLRDDDPQD